MKRTKWMAGLLGIVLTAGLLGACQAKQTPEVPSQTSGTATQEPERNAFEGLRRI